MRVKGRHWLLHSRRCFFLLAPLASAGARLMHHANSCRALSSAALAADVGHRATVDRQLWMDDADTHAAHGRHCGDGGRRWSAATGLPLASGRTGAEVKVRFVSVTNRTDPTTHFAGDKKVWRFAHYRTLFPWYLPTVINTEALQNLVHVFSNLPPSRVFWIDPATNNDAFNGPARVLAHNASEDLSVMSMCLTTVLKPKS